jgi:hypothetical protein
MRATTSHATTSHGARSPCDVTIDHCIAPPRRTLSLYRACDVRGARRASYGTSIKGRTKGSTTRAGRERACDSV